MLRLVVKYVNLNVNLAKQRLDIFVLESHDTSILPSFVFLKRYTNIASFPCSLQNMRKDPADSSSSGGKSGIIPVDFWTLASQKISQVALRFFPNLPQ
jgi:hypothetical protein